jgi:hypothetical protein
MPIIKYLYIRINNAIVLFISIAAIIINLNIYIKLFNGEIKPRQIQKLDISSSDISGLYFGNFQDKNNIQLILLQNKDSTSELSKYQKFNYLLSENYSSLKNDTIFFDFTSTPVKTKSNLFGIGIAFRDTKGKIYFQSDEKNELKWKFKFFQKLD